MRNPGLFMLYILIFLLFLFFPKESQAIAKFNTSYQIYYQVEETGNTHVTIVVNQKNNLSVVFATDYGLNLSQTKIDNVRVSDEGTLVNPEISRGQSQTTISFPFAHKIVGKDKIHKFSLEYDTGDIAIKNGNTWQINIPRFETDENITEQTAILTVPKNFEKPAYIDPKPDLINGSTYYFSSKILGNKPISAIFGKNQYYKAQITYNLDNPSSQNTLIDIAIPPLTAYQDIYIENLDPKPVEIKSDIDGNLLARYSLSPKETKIVNLKMYFKLNFVPQNQINQNVGENTSTSKIWDKENLIFTSPEIKNLTSPKSIYDFVANKLKYDFQKIARQKPERVSASTILANPQSAICTDYTDLFVTLARKAGIPARELEGLALSDNPGLRPVISSTSTDILHAWPEYFDPITLKWVQVDPTWGSTTKGIDYFTKLDFNHLVFAIHGQDPEYPIPAGGYKTSNQKTRDIQVEPITEISFPKPQLQVRYSHRQNNKLVFIITNNSGVYFQGNVSIKETDVNFEQIETPTIPPFSQIEVKAYLKNNFFLGKTNSKAIIDLNGELQDIRFTLAPYLPSIKLLTLGSIFLGIATLIARSLFFRRRK